MLSLWDDDAASRAEVGAIRRGEGRRPDHARPQRGDHARRSTPCSRPRAPPVPTRCTSAVERDWGGYTGYFGDPDGYRWEIAYNPGPIGQVVLP